MPKSVLPPVGFSATVDGFTVRVSWSADPGSAKIVGYVVTRNGKALTTTSETSTSYTDAGVRPGKTYTYEIRAEGAIGASDPVSDQVKIKTPSLKEARFEGDFGVTAKVVSQSGYGKFEAPTFGWQFMPKCRQGACDVNWRDVASKSVHGVLAQEGNDYSGSYSGYFGTVCQGTHSTSNVDIALRVVKAQVIEGEWRATKLEGTVDSSEAPQFGCGSAHASLSVKLALRTAG